jgi:hypothetical protein
VEDAYPIAKGEIALESGIGFQGRRNAVSRLGFHPQVLYGAFYNTQLEIGADVITDLDSSKEGNETFENLALGVLYNFNTETLRLPALAVKLELEYPSGDTPGGVNATLGGLLTRSFGRLRTHLNAEYTLVISNRREERDGFYGFTIGLSYPRGYPIRFRETLIADVFTHQSEVSGEDNSTGIEIGIRHQFSPRFVLDGGVGTELTGPPDRSVVFGTLGLSLGF